MKRLIFMSGDWKKSPIKKGEGLQTLCFVLTGYLLSGILAVWCMTNINYQIGIGTSYPITRESLVFGMLLTVLCGFLIPGVCFWFKFYRWYLAWVMMLIVGLGLVFTAWYFEKRPEAIIRQTFGKYTDGLKVEAFAINGGYESSYKAFCLSGNTAKFQEALEKTFPNGQMTAGNTGTRLLEFMRSSSPIVFNWACSNFLRTWKTDDGKYYLWLETWNNFHEEDWNRMIQEAKP